MTRVQYGEDIKIKIIDYFKNGESQISIAKRLNINKSIISRLIKKYKSTGSVKTIKSGGRPRKTNLRADKQIVRLMKQNPFLSSKKVVEDLNLNISASTVRKRALENGLRSFRPSKKPILTKKHLKKRLVLKLFDHLTNFDLCRNFRLEFAKQHVNWTPEKWNTVLFSDESKFNLFNSDGICHVRRPRGKRLNPRYCQGTIKHGGGNVMVWTCFSGTGVGPFIEIDTKMDRFVYRNILESHMLPYAEWEMPLRWVFQQDNDPKHTSKLVKEWFSTKGVQVMEWPAQSPDLNPIENLFGILKRKIGSYRFKNKN